LATILKHALAGFVAIADGNYEPKPVRRGNPKPTAEVWRNLGTQPCWIALILNGDAVLQRHWNPTFSQYSYGSEPLRSALRRGSSAANILRKAMMGDRSRLGKIFSIGHHDLMGQIAKRV